MFDNSCHLSLPPCQLMQTEKNYAVDGPSNLSVDVYTSYQARRFTQGVVRTFMFE